MTSPVRSLTEPDPTTPDPVAYWKAWAGWAESLKRKFTQAPITAFMEAPTLEHR